MQRRDPETGSKLRDNKLQVVAIPQGEHQKNGRKARDGGRRIQANDIVRFCGGWKVTKEECAAYLTERGYPAENDNGVVMIRKEKPITKKELQQVKAMMRDAGYNASYGYKSCAQPS